MKKIIVLTSLIICSIQASEVDSFTYRHDGIEDSLSLLNKRANENLQSAVDKANAKSAGCSEKTLYKQMRKYFSNQHQGKFGKWVVKTDELDKRYTHQQGIYKNFTFFDSPAFAMFGKIRNMTEGELLNVGGKFIGTDKFEHFLGSGYLYFKRLKKNKKLTSILKLGIRAEKYYMGSMMIGVMSYGDLSANFNGMRFWNHVLLQREDVLGKQHNLGPYVACADNKWAVVGQIDWSNYFDDSMDEGVNCSRFKKKKMVAKVKLEIQKLNNKHNVDMACPMPDADLEYLRKKYKRVAPYMLNLEGFSSL